MGSERSMEYRHFKDMGFEFELTCDLGQVASPLWPPVSFVEGSATQSVFSCV